MANFYVRNSLGNLTVKFNITLRYFVIKGEEGEHMWVLEIGTTHKDVNGDPISAKKIHNIAAENLDDVIETALADLCTQIDWSPFADDKRAPFIDYFSPVGSNVSIASNIDVVIKDRLLSAGIDLSNMKVILNNSMQDFDITSEVIVEGDAYEYRLKWITPLRVYDTYD
jgi:hypothetical protein